MSGAIARAPGIFFTASLRACVRITPGRREASSLSSELVMPRRNMFVIQPGDQASYRSQTHSAGGVRVRKDIQIRRCSRSGFSGITVAYPHGHAGCDAPAGTVLSYGLAGRGTCRRPPVWRAVVRPARSFFTALRLTSSRGRGDPGHEAARSAGRKSSFGSPTVSFDSSGRTSFGSSGASFRFRGFLRSPFHAYLPWSARRRTIGTNVLKSTGLGTCRSNPASIAASTSRVEA